MNHLYRNGLIGGLIACVGIAVAGWLLRGDSVREPTGALTTSVVPSAHPEGKVTVWSWNIAAKSLQHLAPQFERTQPAVKVDVDMTGARMQTRLMLSLAAGVGAPDVSQFELTDAPRYIATGRLTDLTSVAEKYRSMFPASLWENCTMNGRVYAIPWDIGPCGVFYKRDLFQRYGIDPAKIETWDDYIAAGKTIYQRSGGHTKMLPLGSNSLRPMFEMLIQQNGGQVFDDQGRIAINSPQTRQALATIQKMRAAGICSDVALWSQEFLAGLNDESIATYPIAVWFAGTIKDTVKDFAGKKADWGVFRLPAITPGGLHVANLGGSVLVIPAQCRNKAAAWAFVEYALCTNAGQLEQYRSMSLFPAYLPALETPVLDEPDPFFGGQKTGRLFATDVMKISKLNRTPAWGEAIRYLDQELSRWAAGGMQSDGFFENLEQKMHKRLDLPIAPHPVAASAPLPPVPAGRAQ
jgi:lactose/L-arabinose transport system substrate-binding protein